MVSANPSAPEIPGYGKHSEAISLGPFPGEDRFRLLTGEQVAGTVPGAIPPDRPSNRFSARFKRLVREWKAERSRHSSRPDEWAMCWPYQKIIAMGPAVVPLILEEMRHTPDHWFWALGALTDTDPVPAEKRGQFSEMTKAWLEWGNHHYGIVHS